MEHELIIVGAGACGTIAAILAKDMGIDVGIIEGNDRIGKKILSTGNGRCNITNSNITIKRYHSSNSEFFKPVLDSFTSKDTVNFFNGLGLPLVTLECGKLYPMSLQSSSVLDILRFSIDDRNIPLYLNSKITGIKKIKNKFILTDTNCNTYKCKKLILCCGGKSAPKTGSDGSGFRLAKLLGHNIIAPIPALVQLKLNYRHLKALSGIKFNGNAQILVDGICKREEFGEVLFTDYGISGPPILQLSRIASKAVFEHRKAVLKIDMMYNMNKKELSDFLENHWAQFPFRDLSDSLIGIVNKKLIPIILKEANIKNIHEPCSNLEYAKKQSIISILKEWTFTVTDTNGFSNSQVTSGGVDTREVNSETLESKIVPGLYFAGEILDVDGDCGGFNLQWAWSSGFTAARNASEK